MPKQPFAMLHRTGVIFPPHPTFRSLKRKLDKDRGEEEAAEDENRSISLKPKHTFMHPAPILGDSSGSVAGSVRVQQGVLAGNKGITGMKSLTDVLTELQAMVATMKSNGHILKSVSLPALENHIKKVINIWEDVQQQIKTLQTAHEELAATVERQEQDLVKIEGRMEHMDEIIGELTEQVNAHSTKKAKEEERSAPKNKGGKGKKNTPTEVDDTESDVDEMVVKIKRNNNFDGLIRIAFYHIIVPV
ncbi:hypothetical protein JB92DRAFT_3126743 [Gautieria morchelliformis]|nr:hypothetical protein JB92DRAFT_3126743 [Gautieria morchelliformis]